MLIKACLAEGTPIALSDGNYILFTKKKERTVFTVTDRNFEEISRFETGKFDRDATVFGAENTPLIGMLNKRALNVYRFDGSLIRKLEGDYIAAAFSPDGLLCCVKRITEELISIELYDHGFNFVNSLDLEDSLYESAAELSYVSGLNNFLLELMAGQDGCLSYLLRENGRNIEVIYDFAPDLTCITFNDRCDKFMAILHGEDTYGYYTYPDGEEIATMSLEDTVEEDEEYYIGYTLIPVKGDTYIINHTDRYFIYDAAAGAVSEEFIIEGHEPRPASEIYKNLKGDDTLITDISYMSEIGEIITARVVSDKRNVTLYFDKSALNSI